MKKVEGKQHRSRLVLGLLWSVGLMFGGGPATAQARARTESEHALEINVWVYNYAQVPRKDLAEAERESGAILSKAGIRISWLDCPSAPCEQPPGPTTLSVILLPQSMAETLRAGGDVFGFAITSTDGRPSVRAEIFYDRVRTLTGQFHYSTGSILGSIMAHELGHLLLETSGHAPIGIMRARWSYDDLLAAACGQLLFTPQQAERMRIEVRERIQEQGAKQVSTGMTPSSLMFSQSEPLGRPQEAALAAAPVTRPTQDIQPTLTLRVYNYARLDSGVLVNAEKVAMSILNDAGAVAV